MDRNKATGEKKQRAVLSVPLSLELEEALDAYIAELRVAGDPELGRANVGRIVLIAGLRALGKMPTPKASKPK